MARTPTQRQIKRLPREERLTRIKSAARMIFEQKGYEDTAMAEIAAGADLSEAALYKFYEGKHALVAAVIEDWYEELISDITANLSGIPDPLARLRFLIWRQLKAFAAAPGLCRVILLEMRGHADYRGSPVHDCNRRYTAFMLDTLEQGISDGVIRADAPAPLLRDLIYGGIEHSVWDFLSGRKKSLNVDDLTEQIFNMISAGVSRAAQLDDALARLEQATALINQKAGT